MLHAAIWYIVNWYFAYTTQTYFEIRNP